VALEAMDYTAERLAFGIINAIGFSSPEAIFLFGGAAAAGNYIFKPTKVSMERHLMPVFRNKVKILPSELKESQAAILGASALVWKEIEKSAN